MQEEKNTKNEKKEKHLTLHEITFLLKLFLYFTFLPFIFIFYLIKGKPKKTFSIFKALLKEEFYRHKPVLFLISINLLVFLLFYFFSLLDYLFQTDLIKIWQLIFISSKENLYLFNLSFMAHFELKHLLLNLIALYYTAYILNHKKINVIKLYFIFGFLENLFLFLLSFFIDIPPNLGASGVISAFFWISIIIYPSAFSILFIIIYLFFYQNTLLAILSSLNLSYIINVIFEVSKIANIKISEGNTFVLAHFLGYFIGSVYLMMFKDLNKIKRAINFLFFLFCLFLIFRIILYEFF